MIDLNNKYIYALKSEATFGKPVYMIVNKTSGSPIAQIGWYPRWKCYVMAPLENTVFNDGCLKSIYEFMDTLKERNPAEGMKELAKLTGKYYKDWKPEE